MRLQIEKAVYGGSGLAHQTEGEGAGRAVFVPFTLPGEVVEANLTGETDAALVQVLVPSADRVKPGCAHFGECGGCHYQHAEYAAQLEMKAGILRETLERAGLSALPEVEVHSAEPWGYRNRTQLRVVPADGAIRVGYNRRGTNDFLAIDECPILAPLLWRAAEALVHLAEENSAAGRWMRGAVEVELFTDSDESKLQMSVLVQKAQIGFEGLCERMQGLVPELVGAGASLASANPAKPAKRRSQGARPLESWGAGGLSYQAADEDYWVSRGGFFQVNRFLLDELVRVVTVGRKGSLAWDLYAGVGLFSRALARGFEQVVAVEAAASDLVRSFKGAGKRAVEATTVEFLRGAVVQRERPDLVVMDPPRAGVGAEVCALLARVFAPTMVYVSCDPVTLARDLKMLVAAGYKVTELHMVDLFPQTFHLETVVVLRR